MDRDLNHISICVCTFRRPDLLMRLLNSLTRLRTDNEFTYSVVITDNDARQSARAVATAFANGSSIPVSYDVEPRQNIALARNNAIGRAEGEYIAFIDDDEFPETDWLQTMLKTCQRFGAEGVLGPVRPHFETPPPSWVVRGGFCERPEYPTGRVMDWTETRTGNVLFRRRMLGGAAEPFDPRFGNGGEDKDFFMRMARAGHVFRWCNEGVVYETVPPGRWTRRYMLKRALLRGKNSLKFSVGRFGLILRSFVALPAYLFVLPITLFLGHHVFMRYCIRLCDHTGRILALVGLNPIDER